MKSSKFQGELVTWKDERGFGFIKPNNSSQEIFIHISSLAKSDRRPQVGDKIWYQKTTDSHGKISAINASIQGLSGQRSRGNRRKQVGKRPFPDFIFLRAILAIGISSISVRFIRLPSFTSFVNSDVSLSKLDCDIKGNISISTGKKLYHLPGMEDYKSTVISRDKGEKWFCSESEAINSGWSKAPN